jgi:hypothetical protein
MFTRDPSVELATSTNCRYDQSGRARVFGATALKQKYAPEESWQLCERFKTYLSPSSPPLPMGLTPKRVYADFFNYLLCHTGDFFGRKEFQGKRAWDRVTLKEFVFAHPPGWTANEQRVLREAAIIGGLVSREDAEERVYFVSEREAVKTFVMHALSPGGSGFQVRPFAFEIWFGDGEIIFDPNHLVR